MWLECKTNAKNKNEGADLSSKITLNHLHDAESCKYGMILFYPMTQEEKKSNERSV